MDSIHRASRETVRLNGNKQPRNPSVVIRPQLRQHGVFQFTAEDNKVEINMTNERIDNTRDAKQSLPIQINCGNPFTNSSDIVLNFDFDRASSMKLSFDGISWQDEQPYVKQIHYALPESGETRRSHTIFVKFIDVDGHESETFSASIILDTVAPAPGGFEINSGATVTDSLTVTLEFWPEDHDSWPEDALLVALSLDGEQWDKPRPYTDQIQFVLADVIGKQTIYAKYLDAAGNESEPFYASIVYEK